MPSPKKLGCRCAMAAGHQVPVPLPKAEEGDAEGQKKDSFAAMEEKMRARTSQYWAEGEEARDP